MKTISINITTLLLLLLFCLFASPTASTLLTVQHHAGTTTTTTTTTNTGSRISRLCPAGQFRDRTRQCKLCPPGTYRSTSTSDGKCVKCGAGTFQPLFGATKKYLCRSCYPGTYSGASGSRRCFHCSSQQSSGFGATKCVRCPPGTHVSFRGSKCMPCPFNEYSDEVNARECKLCLDGKVTHNKSKCDTCKSTDACFNCPKGMVRNLKNECVSCPMGMTTYNKQNVCSKCRPGSYKGAYDYDCYACGNGLKGAPSKGAMACKMEDKKCPHGLFLSAGDVCVTCEKGEFRNMKSNECEKCPQGTVSEGGLSSTKCLKCNVKGSFPTNDLSQCTCGDGAHLENGKCVKCSRGSFRNDMQHVPNFGCEPCPPGWFAKEGAPSCSRCPYGTVANSNADECVPCPLENGKVPNVLSGLDLYYEYGQTKCIDGRSGKGQGGTPIFYH